MICEIVLTEYKKYMICIFVILYSVIFHNDNKV